MKEPDAKFARLVRQRTAEIWGYAKFEEIEWREVGTHKSSFEIQVEWVSVNPAGDVVNDGEIFVPDVRRIDDLFDSSQTIKLEDVSVTVTVEWLVDTESREIGKHYFGVTSNPVISDERLQLMRESGWDV